MASESVTDGEYMVQLARGDGHALDALIRRHHGFVVRHARRYVTDGGAADDIAQEVFLRVLRFAHQFQRDDNFCGWLATLTTRLALNELRTRKRKHWRSAPEVEPAEQSWRSVSQPEEVGDELLRQERLDAVHRAIEELPENQRQALWLQRFEGWDLETVGQAMGLSVAAIKSLLHRARLRLAEKLSEWDPAARSHGEAHSEAHSDARSDANLNPTRAPKAIPQDDRAHNSVTNRTVRGGPEPDDQESRRHGSQ